ncbi:hypodermin-A isoform X2 [Bicyclus anynana]|uniref:trypsin n=1 Tax=Bicyclus anynana TaxID=110368 RepID=A0ABM3M0X8_BICAN|nr:hypodermin-A isoform X2 [Bicyclus anynana]
MNKESLRIRGGNTTDTKNYPYVAAIIINGRLWCAGAIVDVNWVLTAAHCLNYVLHVAPMKTLGKYVKVRVGSAHPHEGGELVDVAGAVRHPKFEEEPVPHADIALLKLSENLEFQQHINLIKIYDGMTEPYAQSFVVVAGWGATRFDAGAPAVQYNRLMGVMSFGPERCGHPTQPAVFVKAFYFRDFVKHTISSYKTTAELIEALKDIDPVVRPPVHIRDDVELVQNPDEVTEPDYRHD